MARSLAHIEKIVSIDSIPNADKIVVATVLGWKVVIKKDEFCVGDKVIYIEIDSRVPKTEPYFEFLKDRNYKVKSIKLRKQVSQGLIAPMNLLRRDASKYDIGQDVTGELGIVKIEEDYKQPVISKDIQLKQKHKKLYKMKLFKYLMKYNWFREIAFKVLLPKKKKKNWLEWVAKTDEERVQNMPWILTNKEPFIVTEKVDGTSSTFTLHKEKGKWKFYVCSRNVIQDTPEHTTFYSDIPNVYWEMAKKYDIENVLKTILKMCYVKDHVTLQGEIIGEGIQKNKYDIAGHELRAFNLIIDGKSIDSIVAKNTLTIASDIVIPFVPILQKDYILPDTIDELMEYSTGTSQLNDTLREGIVYRQYHEDGTVTSFKCVSNKFLLKWGL